MQGTHSSKASYKLVFVQQKKSRIRKTSLEFCRFMTLYRKQNFLKVLFLPGSNIYLKYSEQWAQVMTIDEDGFLEVKTPDEEYFMVHKDDVLGEEEYAYNMADRPKEPEVIASKASSVDTEGQYTAPGQDFYLIMVSKANDAIAEEYQCWLANHTPYECSFTSKMESLEGTLYEEEGLLDADMQFMFCELFKEDLSMQARIDIHLEFIVDEEQVRQTLRYRFQPKKLLQLEADYQQDRRLQWVLLLETPQLHYKPDPILLKSSLPTKRKSARTAQVAIHDIHQKAAFPLEIDLHAEKLSSSLKGKKNFEILQMQLKAFEDYLNQAIRLGMDRVFVIHGVGQGKLKEQIHQRLDNMHFISSFKNEYHPRYGWGATEIVL